MLTVGEQGAEDPVPTEEVDGGLLESCSIFSWRARMSCHVGAESLRRDFSLRVGEGLALAF